MKAKKLSKGTIIGLGILILIWARIVVANLMMTYAITVDGETVVVVKNKTVAKTVLKEVLLGYVPDDSDIKSISVDKNIDFRQMGLTETFGKDIVKTDKDAIAYLADKNGEAEELFNATVTSEVTRKEEYTPDIDYREDDSMLAGQSRVEDEGENGVANITYSITSVNGEVTNEEAIDKEVITEGRSAIIYKGTVGVPNGEDWRTYEGDAVYTSDEDIIARAKAHLGCPYKYGGRSFANGIDCVFYVVNVYKELGVNVPHKHSQIRKFGKGVSKSNMKPGDIICYGHHVAIYVGNGKMAEATRKYGTRIGKVRGGIITVRRPTRAN
ncbi:MAG: G5 domain-containing protein [Eubacterium sp.]|nr:G5 domain-containing protein [Candidatus Colimonas fimequi]